jgi:hypothetical protein
MHPDFAIIGAQKAASSLLQKCLQAHPDVFIPEGELATFENPQYAEYDPDTFASHFAPGRGAERVGMKRPSYLHEPAVPARLAKHLPEIKLIVVLRDPVERAVSAYFHQMRQGFAPVVDVNRGLTEILNGNWEEAYPRTSQIIDYGEYHRQLSRYLKFYNRDAFFLTTYRDLTTRPEDTLRSIHEFLRVQGGGLPDTLDERVNRGVYSLLRVRVVRWINFLRYEYFHDGQRLRPSSTIQAHERFGLRLLRAFDRRVLEPYLESGRPDLRPDVLGELVSHYQKDATHLRDSFDLDIDHWSVFDSV